MAVSGVSPFFKAIAGWLKLAGAVLFTIMIAQLAAYSVLLAGSTLSAIGAARKRDWMPLCIDGAFIVANGSAICRILVG